MPMTPHTPEVLSHAYALPSVYVNNLHLCCTNGMFRLTFFEHATMPDGEVQIPRASVTMTAETAKELAVNLAEFVERVKMLFSENTPTGSTMQ